MSNTAKVYSQITGRQERHDKRIEEIQHAEVLAGNVSGPSQQLPELELSAQNKFDWLQHPRTQKMFQELGEEIKNLEGQAVELANSSLSTTNNRLIEQCLVRSRSLREVIRIYSK